ncbi:hypothetical protein NKI25_35625 [Mesorhizobium sp. M0808]|uniref:hypothetical protein n=1 Tax=Mesorhizobium sp. M0808 TaxID=2957002 RepID=UPI0033356E5F
MSRLTISARLTGSNNRGTTSSAANMRRSSCRFWACCCIVVSIVANRFKRWRQGYALCVDELAQLSQAGEGKPRRGHHGRRRRVGLGHPCRQQEPAAAWQLDDEVGVTGVKETPQDREAFAGMSVMRIPDNDFKRLLLGSMLRV